jgi:hypothetical protein
MESRERISEEIRDIAQRSKNVTLSDIERVVRKLEGQFPVVIRQARHGVLFRVGDQRFMVNPHNPGSKQVKEYSVHAFIDAMIELGLYEE